MTHQTTIDGWFIVHCKTPTCTCFFPQEDVKLLSNSSRMRNSFSVSWQQLPRLTSFNEIIYRYWLQLLFPSIHPPRGDQVGSGKLWTCYYYCYSIYSLYTNQTTDPITWHFLWRAPLMHRLLVGNFLPPDCVQKHKSTHTPDEWLLDTQYLIDRPLCSNLTGNRWFQRTSKNWVHQQPEQLMTTRCFSFSISASQGIKIRIAK